MRNLVKIECCKIIKMTMKATMTSKNEIVSKNGIKLISNWNFELKLVFFWRTCWSLFSKFMKYGLLGLPEKKN